MPLAAVTSVNRGPPARLAPRASLAGGAGLDTWTSPPPPSTLGSRAPPARNAAEAPAANTAVATEITAIQVRRLLMAACRRRRRELTSGAGSASLGRAPCISPSQRVHRREVGARGRLPHRIPRLGRG